MTASPGLRGGITDSGAAYYHDPATFYPQLEELGVQLLRVHLNWGGRLGVATRRPAEGTDFDDPAYDWRLYDRVVLQAQRHGVEIVFTIFGTPAWANGGGAPTRAPRDATRLREFAYAAATRYSGTHVRPDGTLLPRVRYWTAWNEPNLQIGLIPQWRRVGKRWVIQSAIDYARICNAVVDGVHTSMLRGQKVACGVTAARGNNNPNGTKPSVSPLAFLRAMKKAGARDFDAYAHHPYYGAPSESPATASPGRGGVTLGNIDDLVSELTRLYGAEADLADGVRLPDESAGRDLRRLVGDAGAVRGGVVRDREGPSADRHAALVPAPGRGRPGALAVRLHRGGRQAEALVRGVPHRRSPS